MLRGLGRALLRRPRPCWGAARGRENAAAAPCISAMQERRNSNTTVAEGTEAGGVEGEDIYVPPSKSPEQLKEGALSLVMVMDTPPQGPPLPSCDPDHATFFSDAQRRRSCGRRRSWPTRCRCCAPVVARGSTSACARPCCTSSTTPSTSPTGYDSSSSSSKTSSSHCLSK